MEDSGCGCGCQLRKERTRSGVGRLYRVPESVSWPAGLRRLHLYARELRFRLMWERLPASHHHRHYLRNPPQCKSHGGKEGSQNDTTCGKTDEWNHSPDFLGGAGDNTLYYIYPDVQILEVPVLVSGPDRTRLYLLGTPDPEFCGKEYQHSTPCINHICARGGGRGGGSVDVD